MCIRDRYYLIYPLIKKEIFDLEGPQKKEYIDQIIEEQCKISDMRKFMFETKIFELYEKMDHLYQYEGFFYASRMIESYEENCDKSDYESWLGIYEENYDLIGDKVDVMKIINTFNTRQQTIIKFYYGVEKMCIRDRPYNTGTDFIYRDKDVMKKKDSEFAEGNVDDFGNRFTVNMKSQNRFHENWLTNMYTRLSIAKDILSYDGIIFISIDDNEVFNLKKICDEIFGACLLYTSRCV